MAKNRSQDSILETPSKTIRYEFKGYTQKEIEDFDRLVECWGNVHILDKEDVVQFDATRSLHKYIFKCGREYQSENTLSRREYYNSNDKPDNACPGCCPTMEEIDIWR